METNWEREYIALGSVMTVENLWSVLKCKLLDQRNQFVSKRTAPGKPSWKEMGSFPISKHLQEASCSKHVLRRRWMSAKHRGDVEAARLTYAKARKKMKTMMGQAKRKFEKGIITQKPTQNHFGLIFGED